MINIRRNGKKYNFEENWRIVQMIGMFKVSKESEIFLKRIESFIDKFLFYDLNVLEEHSSK